MLPDPRDTAVWRLSSCTDVCGSTGRSPRRQRAQHIGAPWGMLSRRNAACASADFPPAPPAPVSAPPEPGAARMDLRTWLFRLALRPTPTESRRLDLDSGPSRLALARLELERWEVSFWSSGGVRAPVPEPAASARAAAAAASAAMPLSPELVGPYLWIRSRRPRSVPSPSEASPAASKSIAASLSLTEISNKVSAIRNSRSVSRQSVQGRRGSKAASTVRKRRSSCLQTSPASTLCTDA
mmetsp:Transcript_138527/g.251923  ORF Transcript_138527/g.251923 Transcript_138527/m.251923 type:complete len:240 (+) Transcript_138527:998-1717(+)